MSETPRDQVLERLEAQAADWLARLHADALADHDVLAFEDWLQTPGAQAAFDRAEALWLDLEDLQGLESAASPQTAPVQPAPPELAPARPAPVVRLPQRRAARPGRWMWAAGFAIAASIAGLVLLPPGGGAPPTPTVYEAPRGENRRVDLADGSHVQIGGGSRLLVSFDRKARRVELASGDGEAAFDVAKDPGRPFVIRAGDHAITVVGTEFDVRRAAGRLVVTVRRGVVQVAALAGGSRPVRLTPGQQFSHKAGEGAGQVTATDPSAAFGWTTGERSYREQPLPEVSADLNRYFAVPIRVDPSAASLKFTGFLKIDEEEAVLRRLQVFLPITVVRGSDAIVIRHAPG